MTLVLIHGGTANRDCRRARLPLLPSDTFALDLPGRGACQTDHATISLHGNAREVLAELDAAKVERAHFVGHSLGGATILAIADLAPGRVSSLTFVSAPVPADGGRVVDAVGNSARAFIGIHRERGDVSLPAPPAGAGEIGMEKAVAEAVPPFFDPVMTHAAANVPEVRFVRTSQELALSPNLQDEAIADLRSYAHVRLHELAADHMVMLSSPSQLTDILMRLNSNES